VSEDSTRITSHTGRLASFFRTQLVHAGASLLC
jgi:hypothetical protein